MLICLGVAGIAGARQTPMPGYKHRVRAITTEQTPRRARALPSWHERRRTFPSTTELARAKQQNESFPKFYGFFLGFLLHLAMTAQVCVEMRCLWILLASPGEIKPLQTNIVCIFCRGNYGTSGRPAGRGGFRPVAEEARACGLAIRVSLTPCPVTCTVPGVANWLVVSLSCGFASDTLYNFCGIWYFTHVA